MDVLTARRLRRKLTGDIHSQNLSNDQKVKNITKIMEEIQALAEDDPARLAFWDEGRVIIESLKENRR